MEELSMDSLMLDHLTPETGNNKKHIRFEGVGDISHFIEGIDFQKMI